MVAQRKYIALFFLSLILYFSGTCYSVVRQETVPVKTDSQEGLYFNTQNALSLFLLQEQSSPTGFQGWKAEAGIPGFSIQREMVTEPPRLQVIRKIFVVDKFTFSSCKSLILYPFHEFS